MATAILRLLTLCILIVSVAIGGTRSVTSNATMASANANAVAGDTVLLSAGTFTTGIDPAHAGTFAAPIVYMLAVPGSVCSLYVSGTPINLTTSFVIVQGVAARPVPSTGLPPVEITGSLGNNAVISCRLYGGSYENGAHDGTYYSVGIHDSPYNRILNNWIDRGDVVSSNDDYRGNSVEIFGTGSKYNIVEGNKISRVSHFAVNIGYGPTFNIIRNNEIWNIHGGLELQNGTQHNMLEGNWVRSPDMVCSNRNGAAVELYGRYNIMRYNRIDHDTSCAVTAYMTDRTTEVIVNCDATGHAWGDVCSPLLTDRDGRYYHNSFTSLATFPNGGGTQYKFAVGELDAGLNNTFGHHVWLGNIFAQPTDTTVFFYQNAAGPDADPSDTARANIFWRGSPGRNLITAYTRNHTGVYTLTSAKSTFPNWIESSNKEVSPLWVDSTSRSVNRSVEMSGLSLAKDASVCLTRVASGSSGTVVNVGDALWFHFNWGGSPYDRGDSLFIMHGGTYLRREIDSVDYTNNRVILTASATVSAGDSLYVGGTYNTFTGSYTNRLSGARPDIGPYEIQQGGGGTTVPGQATNVAPANGSTQAQPVTFRWRKVSGATQYLLTASWTNWLHDDVYAVTADTFYTYSGMPADTSVIWNVAAINSAGMGVWSNVWAFRTQGAVSYPATLTVDWNNVVTPATLSANTVIQMVNLQRVENRLIIKNPSGNLLQWPSSITWPGLPAPPQPAAGDTSVYWLLRDGSSVIGLDLTQRSSGSSGVSASWVLAQLATYLRNDADIRLHVNGSTIGVKMVEESGGDSVMIRINSGLLEFWDYANGWKSLSDLAAGGGGGGDITGVTAGLGLSGGGTSGDVTLRIDTTKVSPMDTAGAAAKNATTSKLWFNPATKHVEVGTDGGLSTSGGTITNGRLILHDTYVAVDSTRFLVTRKGTSTQTNLAATPGGTWDAYVFAWNAGFTVQDFQQIGRALFQTDYDANGRLDNSTYKIRLAGDNSGTLADAFSLTSTAATFSGNITASSGYINANGIYNSQTYWRMWGSANWMDIITSVTVGSQKMINIDSVYKINGKNIARVDSASMVIAMAGASWLATTNTDSTSGPILMPRYFTIDSVMVALAGTASTDSIKIDVRYGPDYSATGTAVVTTPAQIAASGLWTRTVPNSATIPAFNNVWMKVTKKTGTSKRLTVMLKGRWQ